MSDLLIATMSEAEVDRSYKRARIYARILQWSFGLLVIGVILWPFLYFAGLSSDIIHPTPKPPWFVGQLIELVPLITVSTSSLTLVVSALGTTSTILLGWRAERRQSEEFKLKIKQLELQLQETQAKLVSPAKDIST
jgi:hypothetical protein